MFHAPLQRLRPPLRASLSASCDPLRLSQHRLYPKILFRRNFECEIATLLDKDTTAASVASLRGRSTLNSSTSNTGIGQFLQHSRHLIHSQSQSRWIHCWCLFKNKKASRRSNHIIIVLRNHSYSVIPYDNIETYFRLKKNQRSRNSLLRAHEKE